MSARTVATRSIEQKIVVPSSVRFHPRVCQKGFQHVCSTMAVGGVVGETKGDAVLIVERVPCLRDNYSWLLHDKNSGKTAVVDPAEEKPVVSALKKHGWTLPHILNTHHHWDQNSWSK